MALVHSCIPNQHSKGTCPYQDSDLFERWQLEYTEAPRREQSTDKKRNMNEYTPVLHSVSVEAFDRRVLVFEDNPGVFEIVHGERLPTIRKPEPEELPLLDIPSLPLWISLVLPREEVWPNIFLDESIYFDEDDNVSL